MMEHVSLNPKSFVPQLKIRSAASDYTRDAAELGGQGWEELV